MSEQLKLCPFCGGLPYFSEVRDEDDRRYMVMELTCCGTMLEAIGFGKYSTMSKDEIHDHLKARLVAAWNTRYESEELSALLAKAKEEGRAEAQVGCSRSHPHENMDAMCELRTEVARANNRLVHAQARIKVLADALREYADVSQWEYEKQDDPWRLRYNSGYRDGHGYEVARKVLSANKYKPCTDERMCTGCFAGTDCTNTSPIEALDKVVREAVMKELAEHRCWNCGRQQDRKAESYGG